MGKKHFKNTKNAIAFSMDNSPHFVKETETKTINEDRDLLEIYQEWFYAIPFEISFFSYLKPFFFKRRPIKSFRLAVNKEDASLVGVEVDSKDDFISFLLYIMNILLTQLSCATLYRKGVLPDLKKVKQELILSERELKLKEYSFDGSQVGGRQYLEMVKKWLANENEFIDELISHFTTTNQAFTGLSRNFF